MRHRVDGRPQHRARSSAWRTRCGPPRQVDLGVRDGEQQAELLRRRDRPVAAGDDDRGGDVDRVQPRAAVKLPSGQPASSTMRGSWRRISAPAHGAGCRAGPGGRGQPAARRARSGSSWRAGPPGVVPATAAVRPNPSRSRHPGTKRVRGGAQHQPGHLLGVPVPQQLRDGPAHRVADGDAWSMPSTSSRAAASSAQSASRNRLQVRSPRPWPRWSIATTR